MKEILAIGVSAITVSYALAGKVGGTADMFSEHDFNASLDEYNAGLSDVEGLLEEEHFLLPEYNILDFDDYPPMEPKGELKKPANYSDLECELIAKNYQKEYGGYMVFVSPYDTKTGEWITGEYAGHWMNLKDGFYIDYQPQKYFTEKGEATEYMAYEMTLKFDRYNIGVEFYTLGVDNIPFPMAWHY